jgi:hypothetical protein
MKQDTRVMSRKNARELTIQETEKVSGGLATGAPCSIGVNGKLDGPPADCGN